MIFALMWSVILAICFGKPEADPVTPLELCSPWPVSMSAVGVTDADFALIQHEWQCEFPGGCWARCKEPGGQWTYGWFRKGDMISGGSETCTPYKWGWRCCAEQARNRRMPCHWTGG